MTEVDFPKKFLLSLKWANRVQNRVLLSLKFSHYFLLEDKIKDLPVLFSSASGKVVLRKVYCEALLSKTLPDSLIINISGSKTILILCIYIHQGMVALRLLQMIECV